MRATLLLSLLLASSAFGADALGDKRSELEDLERQLDAARGNVKHLSTKEHDLSSELKGIEEEERILSSQISILRDRDRTLRTSIRGVESGISLTDRTLGGSLDRIRSAMILLYKDSIGGPSVPSIDRARDDRVTRCILSYDRRLVERALSAKHSLVSHHTRKTRDLGEVEVLTAQILDKEKDLGRTQERKERLLSEIRAEKKQAEDEEGTLVRAIQKLEDVIRDLEARWKAKGIAPAALAGKRLASPVEGTVVSSFGTLWHAKYNTRTKNNGVDVKASPGSAVHTVEAGEVVYCSPFMTFGDLVIIDHEGFFSIYGQLERTRVKVGEHVAKGAILGTLYDDGSAAMPVLHFELRVGGEPVNPVQYVQF